MDIQSSISSGLNDFLSSLRGLFSPEEPEQPSPTDQLATSASQATNPVDQGAALHALDKATGDRSVSDQIVSNQKSTGGAPARSASPSPAKTPASQVTVHRGQTLTSIAHKNGVSLKALEAANPNIKDVDSIRVGQTINIPAHVSAHRAVTGATTPRTATHDTPRASNTPARPAANTNATNTSTTVANTTNGAGLDADHRQLAQVLGVGEGNYESYNTGTLHVPGGRVGHSYLNPPAGTVTGRTINDVLNTASLPGTDPNRMFAVGAYQITIPTLRSAVTSMGLTGNEQLTPAMQDRIFSEFLVPTAGNGALGTYMANGTGTVDQAQLAAARQWASVAVPAGYRTQNGAVSDGTMTYYGGPANRANTHETQALRDFLQGLHPQQ